MSFSSKVGQLFIVVVWWSRFGLDNGLLIHFRVDASKSRSWLESGAAA